MRSLDEYMKLPYKLEIMPDPDESGFVASYPELPGCITCGETIAEAVVNAEDAKKEGVSMNQYCVYLFRKIRLKDVYTNEFYTQQYYTYLQLI